MKATPPSHDLHAPSALEGLRERGVVIPAPEQVAVGKEVRLENLAPGAVLHPFTRLHGAETAVAAGAEVGAGGPATLSDAQVGAGAVIGSLGPVTLRRVTCGPGTVLGCGVAEESVFLGREGGAPDFTTGYGFRVRKGSLYEEGANSAQHTDTKMTLLFPWVTLGSNVNWCDLLMAGGTGPGVGDFSELGSGTIHFNFTPRGDKATASLFGDVVNGVFLDRPRLFLGGNGSMIGPLQADFGAVTGAGGRYARTLRAGLNPPEPAPAGDAAPFDLEVYGSVRRLYQSQVRFVAEISALDAWYAQVRALVAGDDTQLEPVYRAARAVVGVNLAERMAQLAGLVERLERSAARIERHTPHDPRIAQQRALVAAWPNAEAALRGHAAAHGPMPEILARAVGEGVARQGRVYTRVIQGLGEDARAAGRGWLKEIRDAVAAPAVMEATPPL